MRVGLVVPCCIDVFHLEGGAHGRLRAAGEIWCRNDTRALSLLVAGSRDRVVPSSLVKANSDLYRVSKAETDYKEYPKQTHLTLLQGTKVADYALGRALCRSNGRS